MTTRRIWIITLVVLVVMIPVDVAIARDIPGYYAIFGLLSCIAIVVVSKWVGKHGLQRDEGYYEDHEGA